MSRQLTNTAIFITLGVAVPQRFVKYALAGTLVVASVECANYFYKKYLEKKEAEAKRKELENLSQDEYNKRVQTLSVAPKKDERTLAQKIYQEIPHSRFASIEPQEEVAMIQHYSTKISGENYADALEKVRVDGMRLHVYQANQSIQLNAPMQYDPKTIVVKVEDRNFNFNTYTPSENAIITDVLGIGHMTAVPR